MSEASRPAAAKAQAASRARRPVAARAAPSAAGPSAWSAVAALQAGGGNRAVSGLLSGGTPLPAALRAEMEERFGESFADVRVHDGPQAARSATALAAHAYTQGEHIVFNARRYAPDGGDGRRLLAHELAHVVQQRRGGAAPALDPQAPHEQAADRAADAVAAGATWVGVEGSTGIGIACDNWFTRKYKALKEEIPEDYRGIAADIVKGTADAVVSTTMGTFLPPNVTEGWGSAVVTAADHLAEGNIEQVQEDVKGAARDRLLDVVGGTSGIVKQATEIIDTAIWVGQENRELRKGAIEAAGGEESLGGTIVKGLYESASNVLLPGAGLALDAYAAGGDYLAETGGKDDFGRPSLTRLYSGAADSLIKSIEETVGGTPEDPGLFTRAEKAELTTMIGSQVALAFVGVEEVKLVLNAAGALGSLRGVVETMRHNKDWASDPTFWGHIIGGVLSVVGLGSSIAKPKIIQLVLKYGWVAAAVPPMVAMLQDYTAYLNGEISEEECDKRMKKHFAAACNVLKDAILHVSQSGGGKGSAPEEGPPAAPKSATASEGEGGPPAASKSGALPEGEASVTPPTKATTPAPVSGEANVVPIGEGVALPQSAASKKLDASLAKQPVEQAGTVTPLRPRKPRTPPQDTEPATQALPREEKLAVGQTHGAEGGAAKPPPLSVVADPDAPRASATAGGGGAQGGPPIGVKPMAAGGAGVAAPARPPRTTVTGVPPAKKAPGPPATGAAPKKAAGAPRKKPAAAAKPAAADPLEARLERLELVPLRPKDRRAMEQATQLVRDLARKNPAKADRLLDALEGKFFPHGPPSGKADEVLGDVAAVQGKLAAEKGPGGKSTQSEASDERALREQDRPSRQRVKQERVKESAKLGEAGGRERAAKEGIAVSEWETPQQWKGEFGKGIDGIGDRGDRVVVLEYKYGGSRLGKSGDVVQMSNEWIGRKIAELRAVGDTATADRLLLAAQEGRLQGAVYWTRQQKAGEVTTRLDSAQLRGKLPTENISESGLIQFSRTKVERAYAARLQELQAAIASGNLPALKNL